jgi:hypothetical protein
MKVSKKMFQLFYSTAVVQQLSLLIVSSAFLFLGLNVAVAWGQTQLTTKTSMSKTATPRKATYHSVKKTSTKATVSHQSKPKASTPEFSLPDGEYLEESPAVVTYPRKK